VLVLVQMRLLLLLLLARASQTKPLGESRAIPRSVPPVHSALERKSSLVPQAGDQVPLRKPGQQRLPTKCLALPRELTREHHRVWKTRVQD